MTQLNDQEIITRYLRLESEAARLVEDWIVRAASPFRRRLASHWDDTLQEIRLEITRLFERGAFRGEASLKTYLWRVVNHACIRQIRKQSRTDWVDLDSLAEHGGPPEDLPLNQLLQKESANLLLRVLAEMSEECCRLWQMILDGLSYQEISAREGVKEGALRVKVLRCRKKAVEMRDRIMSKKRNLAM